MADPQTPKGWSYDFRHVLNWELDRFDGKPLPKKETDPKQKVTPDGDDPDPIARAHEKQLVGLAFSGGGIRSATFNLGVLQALARLKLLGKFDYLSTVSGGGYIGSWLMAWMERRGVLDVRAQLRPERGRLAGGAEVGEIHFLRRFSNYLTPKLGWLGADMWTVIAVYLRNLILNLIVLSSAFAVLLMIPRVVAFLVQFSVYGPWYLGSWLMQYRLPITPEGLRLRGFAMLVFVAFGALVYAANGIVRSMRYFGVAEEKNAGRKVIEGLEGVAGWLDAEGTKLPKAFTTEDGFAWYQPHLDDFVLELRFRFTGDGSARVFVWAPMEKGAKKPNIEDAVIVRIAGPDQEGPSTAAIGQQNPVRPAAIRPGWNDLEITAVDRRCTVRVNGQTINSARIDLRSRVESNQPLGGVLAIEHQKIQFEKLKMTEVEAASGSGPTQGDVQRRIVLPVCLAAFLATFLFGFGDCPVDEESVVKGFGPLPMRQWLGLDCIGTALPHWLCGLIAGSVSSLLVLGTRARWAKRHGQNVLKETKAVVPAAVALFFAAGFGGVAAWYLFSAFAGSATWEVLVWGPPAMLAAFLLTTVLLLGLLGRFMPDERREWWSRLSAWLLIYSLGWIAVFGSAFYGPVIFREIGHLGRVALPAITFAWVASTLSGLIAARGAATGREKSNPLVDLIANAAPYVFVAGFIILLSTGVDALLAHVSGTPHDPAAPLGFIADQWRVLDGTNPIWLIGWFLALAALAMGLSFCLDINQFSMHMLYRNRLGRCYLGASNRLRRAQPFTGFSSDDDLDLAKLGGLEFSGPCAAPYPIINAALNLVGGQELAWQQRKAASFVFTPFHCGYEFPELPPGYCDTETFASKAIRSQKPNPITLATAMAISGAAASPNMGYHSASAPAFLMTVFNVRLGWWLGNPRKKDGYERSGPLNVIGRLICELFGMTNDAGRYVYLSDGGHFENLGIYELVRRRCRFIVACDAEEDHTFGFGGLGNAIEKCRSDFGIDIDIDVEPIRRRSEKGHSEWHCAVGEINYSRVDPNGRDGILVYLKSSLTGDEPTDVLRYAAANRGFPHQSTGDQWFDESQFESYRVLGFHTAENVFGALGGRKILEAFTKEDLFVELKEAWHPPSAATADAFTKHTRTTVAIYDELRTNPDLAFLSQQIYPEWHILMSNKLAVDISKPLRDQLPSSSKQLKAGFYLCNSVLQLFEDAYVDLNLEDESDHPDNRGWMNLFKHWSWAPMLRVTWTICASNYGARFQTFCQRQLGLELGKTKSKEVSFGKKVDAAKRSTPYDWNDKIAELSQSIAAAIWDWRAQLPVGSKMIADASLRVSKEAQGSHIDKTVGEEEALAKALAATKLSIKKALAAKNGQPITFREPQQKDEEWFAAAVLHEMYRRIGVDENTRQTWANTVADLVLSHAAVIADRDSTPAYADELNSVERDLIKSFFIFNPGLAASAEIRRLKITPDPNASAPKRGKRNLNFPFGFAILAQTLLEDDKAPVERLVYFRVQDHLRRMGLARDGLAEMIGKRQTLEIDLRKMHPGASESPTEKDLSRFERLFCSVKNTVVQKAAMAASSTA